MNEDLHKELVDIHSRLSGMEQKIDSLQKALGGLRTASWSAICTLLAAVAATLLKACS